jgi:hypothetical protein
MILGMTPLTFIHVLLSLIGIFSGAVVLFGLIGGNRMDGWTKIFLITTVLTSVTGYFFPFHAITPGIIVGAISLVALAIAIVARYPKQMAGGWRRTYVIFAMLAFYLNVFVLIVQLFLKVPALHALAPKGSEPPFAITQVVVLITILALSILAALRFKETPAA